MIEIILFDEISMKYRVNIYLFSCYFLSRIFQKIVGKFMTINFSIVINNNNKKKYVKRNNFPHRSQYINYYASLKHSMKIT